MKEKRAVLVIDDSPTVRRLAEIVLSQAGYEVYTAEDGDEGLEMAKRVHPSIILVDFLMPRMNGYKLCKIIRSDPELKDIPLILITAKGEDVGQTFEEKFGVLHYFQKPFEPDDLVAKIAEVIGTEQDREEEVVHPGISAEAHGENLVEMMEKLFKYYFEHELKVLVKNIMHEVLKETEVVRSGGLIFSGELKNLSIADILQFISMSALSGRLSVISSNLNAEIYLEKGNIVFATVSKPGYRNFLTDRLIEAGKIKFEEIRGCLADAKKQNLPIGRVLVQKGYVTEDELMVFLRQLTEDAIFHTLAVNGGHFYLEDSPIPLNISDIKFRIPINTIILDGLRKLDESRVAAVMFKSNDMVPVRLITNVEVLEDISLDEKELKVFSLMDGQNTLGDIINKSRLDELEVKRICYTLQKIGLMKIK
ncbi:MAG TPA: response regulator [Nitrospirae bacterium]|nr:response regulator [Nitrospirota bacterium]